MVARRIFSGGSPEGPRDLMGFLHQCLHDFMNAGSRRADSTAVQDTPPVWTEDIVEHEIPLEGVGNVVCKSYGMPCPLCGHEIDAFCAQCAASEEDLQP